MRKLHVADGQYDETGNSLLPTAVNSNIERSVVGNYITPEQLDSKLNGIVEKLAHRMEPDSALTPEVRGVVKAVDEIQGLKNALQTPAAVGIENATSNLVTTVLSNALGNISGNGQQAAAPTPLRNTLAQIAVNNLTGENSPLPQILDAATSILGREKVREGYDAGMQYIEDQQNSDNWPNVVLQLDENNQEDVVLYAQKQGYTDINYAQMKLIEQKNILLAEVEEYQRVQQGGQQNIVTEPPVVQPSERESQNQEPIIEEPIIEEPIKANKVIILRTAPRKLKVVDNETKHGANSYDIENLDDIDHIINELDSENKFNDIGE